MGADFDPFLVRATTMAIMTLAETTGNVFHMDSLGFPRGHLPGVEEARKKIPLGKTVHVLLTNPPFGADIPVERRVGPRLLSGKASPSHGAGTRRPDRSRRA